ncbi:phage portal protein [Rufibacter soli]
MTLTQVLKTINPFSKGYDFPLIQKAASTMGLNLFDRELYRYLGVDMPVYMEDSHTSYLQNGFAFNADVYSIVNYRATLQASIPWKLYRKKGADDWDIVQEHPLLDLVNTLDLRALSIYEDTVGNAYIYAPWLENGPNKGKAVELNVLKADMVQIVSGGPMQPIKGYKYIFDNENYKGIPKEEVLHFRNFNPHSGAGQDLYGMSPLKAAARQVSLSNDGTMSMNAAYKNQGVKAIVYATDSADAQWTQTQAQDLDRTWKQKNGVGRTGQVVFHSKQLGKIDLGLSPVELATLEGMLHSFRQLCNVYDGFPSQLLNDNESSTYNNLDAADKRVYTNCAIPRRARWRDGLNAWLTKRYGEDLYLDYDVSGIDVLQENKKELAEIMAASWWVKVIDKQKVTGNPEDAAMDVYMVPNNLVPIRDLNDLTRPTDIEEEVKRLKAAGISDYGE